MKAMTPSTKTVTRQQTGKLSDIISYRLERSGIKSQPFQDLIEDKPRVDKFGEEIVALVRKYTEIVRVDRSAAVAYPAWKGELMHPELDASGPNEYYVADLEQWLLEGQKTRTVVTNYIYEHLKDNGMLESCLGLRDLLEIQKLGIEVFRRHFAGKRVLGWKSIVTRRPDNDLLVPCLAGDTEEVELRWYWLDTSSDASEPALRFPN